MQQLLLVAPHRVPFRMMASSFGLQQLGCLKPSLLHAVLLQSTTALKAMCIAGRAVGTPCAFLVAEPKRVTTRVGAVLPPGQGHFGSTYNMRVATSSNCRHQACCEHAPTGAGNGASLPQSRMTCCVYIIKVDPKQPNH